METIILSVLVVIAFGFLFWQMSKKSRISTDNARMRALFSNMENTISENRDLITKLQGQNEALKVENATLQTQMKEQERYMDERYNELAKNKEDLQLQFKEISQEIIRLQAEHFDTAQKRTLATVLDPFKTQLADFRVKIENVHKDSITNKSSFDEQFKSLVALNKTLSKDAEDLSLALKGNKKLVGDWGEFQLARVLELSGLVEGVDFDLQSNFKDEEANNLRPDAVVHLPGGRNVIVDSKVSLNDYVKYANAETEAEREAFLKSHIKCIKNHIDELSSKGYQNLIKGSSLDYVIIFVPIESAYIDAVQKDSSLYEYAYKKNIAIATPSSILAILRTVENVWKIEKQSKNVQEIARIGGALYDKIANFVADMDKIGNALGVATKNYTEAMNKLKDGKGSALALTKNLKTLGAKTSKEIALDTDSDE